MVGGGLSSADKQGGDKSSDADVCNLW